jgi:polyphosphate kinase 2
MSADTTQATLRERIHDELVDTVDEELELEIDDHRLAALLEHGGETENAIDRRTYFEELLRLQRELVKLQDWVVHQKLKVVVLFEGRDAAGKGGVIKRVTQRLNPRTCKVVALSAPTERERTQWYFQRYAQHLPAGGEMVLFDRSWYNRAGVERVMGFCTDEDCEEFFRTVPDFERMLVRSGIILIKYWFSITDDEQNLRFLMRIKDPRNPAGAGSSTPRPRKRCWRAPICRKRAGGSSKRSTRNGRGSTASTTCFNKSPTKKSITPAWRCRSASISRTICASRSRRNCTFPRYIETRLQTPRRKRPAMELVDVEPAAVHSPWSDPNIWFPNVGTSQPTNLLRSGATCPNRWEPSVWAAPLYAGRLFVR